MTPKLVTFDCAQTLVRVPDGWSMGGFAADCARHIGLNPTDEDASLYQRLYMERISHFIEVNMSRDASLQAGFWERLAKDWLAEARLPAEALSSMAAAGEELGFGPNSILFKLYDDVVPCLDLLDQMGIQAAVISNWDYSLHKVLRMFGIYDRFVCVKASLEEGVEKPDPRIFFIALEEANYYPEDSLHVGDDRTDDFEGAQSAGIRAVLIDRSKDETARPFIRSLMDLPEAFDWID